ncbi:RIB43A-like with coiled-coils protein 2 [Condylostylus longicornis]|uniref:RIB43A-like with coiled-coils protein 2 n=1 Tax=Condylostylus longicornis TaxID=2530218 RepID=UPI00244E58E3|nr:RIB43A-like with coiled-coils protein 2 [Condylostylus longicornis]
MLKDRFVTHADLKEAAAIERRRQYEESRKKRIFNAKQRLYGQDHQALEKQIHEKQEAKQSQNEQERKWNAEFCRRNEVINAKEREKGLEKKRQLNDLHFYRCQYQKKEDSRDYDLIDPKTRNEVARTADNDARLGISSAQVFAGEDILIHERKRLQKQQLKAWLEQQMKEKRQAEADRNEADIILQKTMNSRDQLALEMANMERNNAQRMQYAVLNYNKKLANEQNWKRQLAKKHEDEDNKAEIYNMITSDILTENPDVAQSRMGLHRKIAFEYRGMNAEELEHFKREQCKQIEERKKRETEEKLKEQMWDQMDMNITRACMLKKSEQEEKNKKNTIILNEENVRLAQNQKSQNTYIDKVLYANECTEKFFDQFNTTSR